MDRFFVLRRTPPFDRLHEDERLLVAEVAEPRTYGPGQRIGRAGDLLHRLYLPVQGELRWGGAGTPAPGLVGLDALLSHAVLPDDLEAGPDGATCLTLSKGPVYTLLYQCPTLLRGLLDPTTPSAPSSP